MRADQEKVSNRLTVSRRRTRLSIPRVDGKRVRLRLTVKRTMYSIKKEPE